MAFTTSLYNHTVKKLLGGEISFANLKVMLLDNNAVFGAAHTTLVDVLAGLATEVSGNGWTAGGMAVASVVSTVTTTNDGTLSASELRVRATGGSIGPAYALVIFDDLAAGDAPILYIDFGGALTAGNGTDFLVPLNSGFITGAY